jgi:large repetitive protein
MKPRHLAVITALAAILVAGVVAGSGSAGTNGISTTKVLFAGLDDKDGMLDVFAANPDGSDKFNISHDAGIRTDATPKWSPDATKVAFARYSGTGATIVVAKADGTKMTDITPSPSMLSVWNIDPAWSPDGTSIVFASDRDGNYDLYTIRADGYGLTRLTKTAAPIQNLEPDWSPDGSTIAFSRVGGDPTKTAPGGLFVVGANGAPARRLTSNRSSYGDRHPEWSPKGDFIVFTSDRYKDNIDVYLLDRALKGLESVQRLTTNEAYDAEATWAPDGTALMFVSTRTGQSEFFALHLMSLTPGEFVQEQLTTDGGKKSAPDLTYSWYQPGLPALTAA